MLVILLLVSHVMDNEGILKKKFFFDKMSWIMRSIVYGLSIENSYMLQVTNAVELTYYLFHMWFGCCVSLMVYLRP